jgi:hypothetical protein
MNSKINLIKHEFLINELMQISIQAGFSTRNAEYPIYNYENMGLNDARMLKRDLKQSLMDYYKEIKEGNISDKMHIEKLVNINSLLSNKYHKILFKKSFRIGVTQKVVNLFLKYLWTTNICSMPHHCPVDNINKPPPSKLGGIKRNPFPSSPLMGED